VLLHPGDHVCAIYTDEEELADVAAEFLADGLRLGERCWYLPAGDSVARLRERLEHRDVDVAAAIDRGSLRILSSSAAYNVRGDFEPEATMQVFSDAIEEALAQGFSGFRAAANMSWALTLENGAERLIIYEALLRSLFSTARATGLCLYDRARMPLQVIDGALSTHPVVRVDGSYRASEFYDPAVRTLPTQAEAVSAGKLARLGRTPRGDRAPGARR
jgi:chemotaxis family two-component system sensor kinase Cph1